MRLSEKSHRKIEEFFRESLGDENFRLPEIYFYSGKFTQVLTTFLKIEGITIGRRVYIFPDNFWLSEKQLLRLDEELVVHEITHVLQYRLEGFWRFLWLYLKSYFVNLKKKKKWDFESRAEAYFEIPYEIEARKTASKFIVWSKKRKLK
jgi:Domain of unknown function (DUF4157)